MFLEIERLLSRPVAPLGKVGHLGIGQDVLDHFFFFEREYNLIVVRRVKRYHVVRTPTIFLFEL